MILRRIKFAKKYDWIITPILTASIIAYFVIKIISANKSLIALLPSYINLFTPWVIAVLAALHLRGVDSVKYRKLGDKANYIFGLSIVWSLMLIASTLGLLAYAIQSPGTEFSTFFIVGELASVALSALAIHSARDIRK